MILTCLLIAARQPQEAHIKLINIRAQITRRGRNEFRETHFKIKRNL